MEIGFNVLPPFQSILREVTVLPRECEAEVLGITQDDGWPRQLCILVAATQQIYQ